MKIYLTEKQYNQYKTIEQILKSKDFELESFENCIELNITIHLNQVQTYCEKQKILSKLNLRLNELPLSNRLKNSLNRHNLVYVRSVIAKTYGELERLDGMGHKSVRELNNYLKDHLNLSIGMKNYIIE